MGFRIFSYRTWIRPPSKHKAKFKHNIVKGIFLGFIPRIVRNIVWYNCETGNIGPANHVKFDEGMNDLPYKNVTPNQRDLEGAEQGDKFLAKPKEVDDEDEIQFYIYPFAKMEEKLMKVPPTCTLPNFGLQIKLDPQYGCVYVLLLMQNQVPPNYSRLYQLQDEQFVCHI